MMKIMRSSLFFLVFFLGTVLPAAVFPEDGSDAALQTTDLGQIIIESRSFEWRIKEKIVVFSDDVTARREDLTIECDKIHVYYHETENGDPDYDRILATGKVKITRTDGSSGTAEEAVYDFAEETITMTGQATFKQGKNTLKGSSLTYNLREESVTGTDVKAVLHSENEEGVSTGGQ
jgi:lipopolysaccharide export system protein LptA